MGILVEVSGALQRLLGEIAESAAAESGVIQRRRKFTALYRARWQVELLLNDIDLLDFEFT